MDSRWGLGEQSGDQSFAQGGWFCLYMNSCFFGEIVSFPSLDR